MTFRRFLTVSSLGFLALAVLGCQPAAPANPTATTTGSAGTTGSASEVKPDLSTVAADLKHDGYKYYGLGYQGTLTYEYDRNGIKSEGQQTVEFAGMDGDAAKFKFTRSGALSQIGDETVVSKKDGVYSIEAQGHKLDPIVLAMPAEVPAGKTWEANQKLTDPTGNPVETATKQTIGKIEKVKTAAGEFDCVMLTMAGTIKTGGKTVPFNAQAWYSADVGTVKLKISGKNSKGEPDVTTITLAKKE